MNTKSTKNGNELVCSEMISSSCSTIGIRRVTCLKLIVIGHERPKSEDIVSLTNRANPWLFVTYIFRKDYALKQTIYTDIYLFF